MSHRFLSRSAWMLVLFVLSAGQVWAAAGEVFYANGAAEVQRGAKTLKARRGFLVESGDVIKTGSDGEVRMRMADDSYIALPHDSTFKIEQFSMPSKNGDEQKPGVSIFSLLKGGFRTISGLIGDSSRDTYQVKSPVVTMGVRGTQYSMIYCANDECGKIEPTTKNGAYVEVLDGGVTATNSGGKLDVGTDTKTPWAEVHSPPVLAAARPRIFAAFSAVFDASVNITTAPSVHADVDTKIDLNVRIEPELPASPSVPR